MKTLILTFAFAFAALAQTVTIGAPVFTGSGLNDASSGGRWTSAPANALYEVTICTAATPDTGKVRKNGGTYSSCVPLTGAAQALGDGVTITFAATTGHTIGNTWAIAATASGSLSASSFIQRGAQATFRSGEDKARDSVSVKDFGALGNYNLTAHTGYDNCAAFTAAAKVGGDIYFPAGRYYSSCGLSQALPSQYRGAGKGDDCATARTCLIFPAGVTGITNELTARGSGVRDMWLHSLATGAGTGDGIRIRDSWFSTFNVGISKFARDGIHADTDNVDDMHIDHTYFVLNYGDGWHCGATTDCNVIVVENSGAQGNGGIGFHQEQGGVNWFSNLNTSGNGIADFDLNGISLFVNMPYCEAAGAFKLRAVYSRVTSPFGGGCTITNLGGPSNVVISGAGETSSLRFGPDTWPGAPISPTIYQWRSGHYGNGVMSLWDDTNSTTIFHYDPATLTFTFDQTVAGLPTPALTDITVTQSSSPPGLILYKNDNAGGGATAYRVRMDGTDGAGTQTTYAEIHSAIELNTVGAGQGSLHLQTAHNGALADQIVANGNTRDVEINGNVAHVDASGNVFANGVYLSGGNTGQTYVAHVMSSNGVTPCTMTFTGGILTNTTCP